jgi:hypothetical protein
VQRAGGSFRGTTACLLAHLLRPSAPHRQVQFLTTGGGQVRFNPNLYNCGKVCLSLLGTWSGPSWQPGISTLLQVGGAGCSAARLHAGCIVHGPGLLAAHEKAHEPCIATVQSAGSTPHLTTSPPGPPPPPACPPLLQVLISIQSMIFVSDPYFNEPGHESYMKTTRGQQASADYNGTLRYHTLQVVVLQALRNPAPAFAPAIRAHFKAKREELAAQCDAWAAEARGGGKQGMRALAADIKAELAKL